MKSSKQTNEKEPKSLLDIFKTYFRFDLSYEDVSQDVIHPPNIQKSAILFYLRPLPWFLAALFTFSFYWDFNGVTATLLGVSLELTGLLRILSISGLIGFLTNRIAITMLFHPLQKRPLLGHGLIPAHKDRIAKRMAHSVSQDLINPVLIRQKLAQSGSITHYRKKAFSSIGSGTRDESFRKDIKQWLQSMLHQLVTDPEFRSRITMAVTDEVEQSIEHKPFDRAALKAYTYFRGRQISDLVDEALQQLPGKVTMDSTHLDAYLNKIPDLLEESGDMIDEVVTEILDKLIHQLDVKKIVEENLLSYDESRLEQLIKGVTNEHLLTIQYLGAVLGTIGGFVIWRPLFSLSVIGILTAIVFTADHFMMTFKNRYSDLN